MIRNLFLLMSIIASTQVLADRIYILPGTGWDSCTDDIIAEIESNGHTVAVSSLFP